MKVNKRKKHSGVIAFCVIIIVLCVGVFAGFAVYGRLFKKMVSGAEMTFEHNRNAEIHVQQAEGWVTWENQQFYYKAGQKQKGAVEIDGKQYYFDTRLGNMRTGWITDETSTRYYGDDGVMVTGAVAIGDGHYYFDEQGAMFKGWLELDGKKYYYGEDGRQLFGEQTVDGQFCKFDDATGEFIETMIDPNKPMVALTWDDGPADATSVILDALEAVGGKGTFFVVGQRVDYYPDNVRRAVSLGCEIGNHTWQHAYLDTLSAEDIRSQIQRTNDKVEEITGVRPTIMRPTGGRVNSAVKENVGMPMIQWTIDTLDWKTRDAKSTIDAVLNNVSDGDIVLMHDLYDATAEASKTIIPELVSRGYQLVTVSELAQYRGGLEAGKQYFSFRPQN